MELGKRTKNFFKTRHARALIAGLMLLSLGVQAASLQTFGTLFQQLTNDLAFLQQNFDGSPGLKLQIALLTRAHGLVLDEDLPDEQALARLVPLLSHDTNYTIVLDDSAFNTRAAILARYDALGERVAALPPWSRATAARTRFANLANEHAALTNAATAAAVASLLPPFVAQLAAVSKYEVRARLMPRPRTRLNSLFAVVDGRRFTSTRGGRNSPNLFEVTATADLPRRDHARRGWRGRDSPESARADRADSLRSRHRPGRDFPQPGCVRDKCRNYDRDKRNRFCAD
jgi:hypothetical protein